MIYKADPLHFFYLDNKESVVMLLKNFYFAILTLATLIAQPALADSLGPGGGGSNLSTNYYNGMYAVGTIYNSVYSMSPTMDQKITPLPAARSSNPELYREITDQSIQQSKAEQELRALQLIKTDLEGKLRDEKFKAQHEKFNTQLTDTVAAIAAHEGEIKSLQDKISEMVKKDLGAWKASQGYSVPTKTQLDVIAALKTQGFSCDDGEIPAVRENSYAMYSGNGMIGAGGGYNNVMPTMSLVCLNKDGYQMKQATLTGDGKVANVVSHKRSESGKVLSSEISANGKLVSSTTYKQHSTEVTTYSNGEITQRCENFHNKAASQGGGRNSGSQPVAQ
jgi:hypothetical protein